MKDFIKKFYTNNFVYKGKEKLSKITIFILIILNISILTIIYQGIDFQTKVINNPSVKFPYNCRDILNNNSKIDDFNSYIYNFEDYDFKYKNIEEMLLDNRCFNIFEKINQIKDSVDIKNLKLQEKEFLKKYYDLNTQISYLKDSYNTILFEKLSNQELENSIIKDNLTAKNIKEKYDNLSNEIEKYKKLNENLYIDFRENNFVKELISYLELNKVSILKDIKKVEREYEIKYELIILLFLIPLVFCFFYMMRNFIKKDKYILYVIFKNILFVSLVPTFISIFSLINIFIPKIFIEKLLLFFYDINIPFVVYYVALAVAILICIFIIVFIQKRFKKNQEYIKNSKISKLIAYNKNICNYCENRVDYSSMNYCPCCQNRLKIECRICKNRTIKGLEFCQDCGNIIKE